MTARVAEPDSLTLELPWPPSVNHYLGRDRKGHTYPTKAAKAYREAVGCILLLARPVKMLGPLDVELQFRPPDRRVRDIDNLLKVVLDCLCKCGRPAYEDDGQIEKLTVWRLPPAPPKGGVTVNIRKVREG